VESAIAEVSDEDRWERRAAQELADELHAARVALCNALLDEGDEFSGAVEVLRTKRSAQFAEAAQLLSEVSTMPTVTMPAVHVAIRAISRLAART
jgi:NAD-specific glutamate dehydrogenase